MRKSLIYLALVSLLLVISCKGRNTTTVVSSDEDTVLHEEVEPNEQDKSYKSNEENLKSIWSRQLDAFELMGDVHTVQYDSVFLKYDRLGNLEFFGFNDSINLFNNVKYEQSGYYELLGEWGDNGWTFTVDSQKSSLEMGEGPIMDFTIRDYNNRWLKRFYVMPEKIKLRPGTPKYGDKDYRKHRDRVIVHRANVVLNNNGAKDIYYLDYSNYKYDDYGNWIQRTVKSDMEPTRTQKRKITYYSQENSNSTNSENSSGSITEEGIQNVDGTQMEEKDEECEDPMALAREQRESY